MPDTVLVTGGAGYIGAPLCFELLAAGRRVVAFDPLAHGQDHVAKELERAGVQVVCEDIRDAGARARALAGVDGVVHLAAIVGDPACARDPELSDAVNVEGARGLIEDARAARVGHIVFASTCSNYGRMADPTVPIDERGELRPVSLYAEQKVGIERMLLSGAAGRGDDDELAGSARETDATRVTCLRLATVYGVAPRMRFDLTVNQFTRDLWSDHRLEVFGERFWRPYVHVRDVARAVCTVLDAAPERVAGEIFNVGCSEENYRKLDLVHAIREQVDAGEVSYVHRDEDPRDYKVSFEKLRRELDFQTTMTVPDGIREVVSALATETYPDPYDGVYRN
jgi:nucleoside-diphosphate-sugar epimerase